MCIYIYVPTYLYVYTYIYICPYIYIYMKVSNPKMDDFSSEAYISFGDQQFLENLTYIQLHRYIVIRK